MAQGDTEFTKGKSSTTVIELPFAWEESDRLEAAGQGVAGLGRARLGKAWQGKARNFFSERKDYGCCKKAGSVRGHNPDNVRQVFRQQ